MAGQVLLISIEYMSGEFAAQLLQQNILKGRLILGYLSETLACFLPSYTRSERGGSWQHVRHHYHGVKEHEYKAKGQSHPM